MFEINDLSHHEKVLLDGCLRGMILADGYARDEEVAGLNRLRDELHFDDLDECLEEFESAVRTMEQFLLMAAGVTRTEARNLILKRLDEIAGLDGYKSASEADFFNQLVESWR